MLLTHTKCSWFSLHVDSCVIHKLCYAYMYVITRPVYKAMVATITEQSQTIQLVLNILCAYPKLYCTDSQMHNVVHTCTCMHVQVANITMMYLYTCTCRTFLVLFSFYGHHCNKLLGVVNNLSTPRSITHPYIIT